MLAKTIDHTNPLWRYRQSVDSRHDKFIVIDQKKLVDFSSNDYLVLANHPDVKLALAKAANQYGLGSTSSPLLSGYTGAHQALEEAFAAFLGRDKTMLFNSGYHANIGIMTTFANRQSVIVADKLCHASLLDGMLLSRASILRYQHQNTDHALALLAKSQNKSTLLVTESVFSMEGSITPAAIFAHHAKEQNAMLVIDDAHGFGVLGKSGKGIHEASNLSQVELPCLVTPLGKTAGSMGAIVSGSHALIEQLTQHARTYRYSTALPPAIAAATLASLSILETENWRREKLMSLISFFNIEAKKRNITLTSNDLTPIRCIMIGDNKKTLQLQQYLKDNGCFVSCIRPPTVPVNSARLRISLTCAHDEIDISQLLDAIEAHHANDNR